MRNVSSSSSFVLGFGIFISKDPAAASAWMMFYYYVREILAAKRKKE